MNILLIGNGFDLAHGLPTKYTDFLEFAKAVRKIQKDGLLMDNRKIENVLSEYHLHSSVKANILACFGKTLEKESEEILGLMDRNFWLEYFLKCPMYQKENWIDFEGEISEVMKSIDADMKDENFCGQVHKLTHEYLNHYYLCTVDECGKISKITYKGLRDELLKDLNRLIRILEIYLCSYVETIPCNEILPDIQNICADKIISFNYTDTYRKLYDQNKMADYDFIHGKTVKVRSVEENDMVLGIDEYLSKKRKNKDLEFIAFKKFYQRIYKQTGCRYKEWLKEDGRYNYLHEKDRHLFIFGHSLDVTDKDILRELILHDRVDTTIFYFNKDDLGSKIANLVRVIGQDELVRRTGERTIEFKLQGNKPT